MTARCWLLALALAAPPVLAAQRWNGADATALVDLAVRGRLAAGADSGLDSYAARAHGIVTFSTELVSGAPLGPRVSKGDELVVEVYWERPDRSKQVIVGWRDSTFFPTRLAYHRDHLALVSDDIGGTIRIGDGDEIADLPHPLSAAGRDGYDFRLGDTLRIDAGEGPVALVALEVRPRNPAAAAVAGTFLLDLERAEVVRSVLTFTRAAYRDPTVEDITVRLERALVEGRYWLPFRQQIEIRRRSTVLDLPLRTVIAGTWEVEDHRLHVAMPPVVRAGAAVSGLRAPGGRAFAGRLADAIDSASVAASAEEFEGARTALAKAWLGGGLPGVRLSAGRVSDLVRVTGVEGLRLGAGVAFGVRGLVDRVAMAAGFGFGDERVTGALEIGRTVGGAALSLTASRRVEDVGDHSGASGVINSLAAQEGGRDLGHYHLAERVGVGVVAGHPGGWRVAADAGRRWTAPVRTVARPVRGGFAPNPDLGPTTYWTGAVRFSRVAVPVADRSWSFGAGLETGVGDSAYGRLTAEVAGSARTGAVRLAARGFAGAGVGSLPADRQFAWGGPGTVVGPGFRQFSGRGTAWLVGEALWRLRGPSLDLGGWGKLGADIGVGPYVGLGVAWGSFGGQAIGALDRGLQPAVGLAVELFGEAARIEFGQCLRCGFGPRLAVDIGRVFWPVS